ncbi:MAG TPA: DNA gyrase subunit B, partial [Candidatus Limnocylindria bacterium]|nr:DNA gyrase subunit B [Candidatus Limnocylindria bacterium]
LKALAKARRDKRAEKGEAEEEKPTKGRRRAAQPATNGPGAADGEESSTSTDEGSDDGKGGREPAISRYKGLAEMNAEQLWDTTLNPLTRTLKRVTLEDAEQADFAFDELMGTEVEGRKKWIMANASKAELDI